MVESLIKRQAKIIEELTAIGEDYKQLIKNLHTARPTLPQCELTLEEFDHLFAEENILIMSKLGTPAILDIGNMRLEFPALICRGVHVEVIPETSACYGIIRYPISEQVDMCKAMLSMDFSRMDMKHMHIVKEWGPVNVVTVYLGGKP